MFDLARETIIKLGYGYIFPDELQKQLKPEELKLGSDFIEEFNARQRKASQFNERESEEVTSIFINYPPLLLRKKSELHPEGRTSYRFKRSLRKKVTIIDK